MRYKQASCDASSDPRWQSVVERDASSDGCFVYSVATTGVYCRPSCPSRLARAENVHFHATPAEAEQAGFRPCKRCKPDQVALAQQHAARVAQACRMIDASKTILTLDTLAKQAGMSKFHFHRLFRRITGVTPHAYAEASRAQRLRATLPSQKSVTNAIYDAGFNANSRFYTKADQTLGMTAKKYKEGGTAMRIRFALGESRMGSILVAQSERGICAILLGDDPAALLEDVQARFPKAEFIGGDERFETLVAQVVGLIEEPGAGLQLPLDLQGTLFQQRVWQTLNEIPPGETATYTQIAERIGSPKAVRAVAGACAANPLAVAIPCHRVVRIGGDLAGYRWGLERKQALLALEAQWCDRKK
ncbi:bifunctional DNA-binding transcriptional regulator/O6-methylguanine-DNA methyltransferase Ada [Oxalicibacterium faecigallinarum]|uniref:methylated-DNA--[protein]-cysteine S-methyltransferase n=1 Tax=Oxalicibacterium faecigallinarum TaxID=573741 RepID=A0A8J3AVA6_9BURK|nr:bifunctional DNA-binding transcriptional regulator/O6-methylguanine-DNA methyltransferase Ada [Oxalicibacterium faecigallinarum]GGI16833.1 bifunctional transcriptional activator/DNA repair enzyme protein Ada [Oxalicibacterium faecigallinarum]